MIKFLCCDTCDTLVSQALTDMEISQEEFVTS